MNLSISELANIHELFAPWNIIIVIWLRPGSRQRPIILYDLCAPGKHSTDLLDGDGISRFDLETYVFTQRVRHWGWNRQALLRGRSSFYYHVLNSPQRNSLKSPRLESVLELVLGGLGAYNKLGARNYGTYLLPLITEKAIN